MGSCPKIFGKGGALRWNTENGNVPMQTEPGLRPDNRAAEEKALEEGRNSVAAAVARAREEIQNKQAELEAEAHARAKVLEEETEKQKAAMRAGAEKKLDAAAMLIVERIVNS